MLSVLAGIHQANQEQYTREGGSGSSRHKLIWLAYDW